MDVKKFVHEIEERSKEYLKFVFATQIELCTNICSARERCPHRERHMAMCNIDTVKDGDALRVLVDILPIFRTEAQMHAIVGVVRKLER